MVWGDEKEYWEGRHLNHIIEITRDVQSDTYTYHITRGNTGVATNNGKGVFHSFKAAVNKARLTIQHIIDIGFIPKQEAEILLRNKPKDIIKYVKVEKGIYRYKKHYKVYVLRTTRSGFKTLEEARAWKLSQEQK